MKGLSLVIFVLLPLATPIIIGSQQELEELVSLSKAGLVNPNNIELWGYGGLNVTTVEPEGLAQLLASCKEGFTLMGLPLTPGQWNALVEKSRGDNWAPKYITLGRIQITMETIGVTGEKFSTDLRDLIKSTEKVTMWYLPLDGLSWPARRSRMQKDESKCRWLEIWHDTTTGDQSENSTWH